MPIQAITKSEIILTIEAIMNVAMHFVSDSINVEAWETIRFGLKNVGAINHEMVVGKS